MAEFLLVGEMKDGGDTFSDMLLNLLRSLGLVTGGDASTPVLGSVGGSGCSWRFPDSVVLTGDEKLVRIEELPIPDTGEEVATANTFCCIIAVLVLKRFMEWIALVEGGMTSGGGILQPPAPLPARLAVLMMGKLLAKTSDKVSLCCVEADTPGNTLLVVVGCGMVH